VVKGIDVLEAFKSDIEGFFLPEAEFVMNAAVNGFTTRYIGGATKGGIAVSQDLANCDVDTLETMMFLLLVLGHEAAHLLNVHGGYRDQSSSDTRALEVWADFYGTKVAISVMTLGDRVRAIVTSIPGGNETATRLDAVGNAIGRLASTYFNTKDERYEPATIRALTCVVGVVSAINTYFTLKGVKRDARLLVDLQLRLFRTPELSPHLPGIGAAITDASQVSTIRRIHQSIQGERTAITQGMHPIPAQWLRTNYEGSDEENASRAKVEFDSIIRELEGLGISLTPQASNDKDVRVPQEPRPTDTAQ